MKLALPGSAWGAEIGAPQIVNPPSELNVCKKPTGWPKAESGTLAMMKAFMSSAYVGDPTCGVLFFIVVSGAGKVLPLTCVYGKISGSSILISAAPWPEQTWMIWRWNICTGQPRKDIWRD